MALINKYFEARNNNKVLIIDDNFKNFGLLEIISFENYKVVVDYQLSGYDRTVLNTIYTGSAYILVNIKPFNAENLLAISCDVSDISFATYVHDDILSVFIKIGTKEDYNVADTKYVVQHVKVLHYVPSNKINRDDGCGLQIFNDKGQKIFDSSHLYLKVADVISQDLTDVSNIDRSYNYNIAVVPLSCRHTRTYNPQRVVFWRHFFKIINNKNLTVKTEITMTVPPQGMVIPTGYFYNTNLLVVKRE